MKKKYSENPALSMGAFRQYIGRMTREQLQEINECVRERWSVLDSEIVAELKVGDVVRFNAKRRGQIHGIIRQFNRKRISLIATSGMRWKVSPALLVLEENLKIVAEVKKMVKEAEAPQNRRDASDFANLLGALGGRRRR